MDQASSLPKLPVPALEQTLQRYLDAVRPLVSDAQFERTKELVKAFGAPGGPGPRLQQLLLERQQTMDNWAYEWWLKDMYLNNPLPLVVNSNPGMVFPPRRFSGLVDQALFAAHFLDGILDHKDILDRKALPIEKATSREKGQPLCMAQYYRLLTSYRIPGEKQDVLFSNIKTGGNDEEHIIVMCSNQIYVMPIKTKLTGRLSVAEMCSQILRILQEAPTEPSTAPIGLLTSEKRNVWASVREELSKYERNVQNLTLIETSLMVICFDEPLPTSFNCRALRSEVPEKARGHVINDRDETNMAHQMIHGGGSVLNSGNRWFDKTVQIVISSDGVCGLCYEHSPSEGVAVIQLMEHLLQLSENKSPLNLSQVELPRPQKLEWNIDERIEKGIQDAAVNLDCLSEDLDFYVYRYVGYGKEFIKSCKVSPDAYIQLALQLTYFRLYNHLVATYESASTRRYYLGRVDCIRSATNETLQWVAAMCQGDPDSIQSGRRVTFSLYDNKKKLELFEAAAKKQTEVMVDNILGQGIDIHLLGLRELSKELGEPLPDIFTDEVYKISNNFQLSTSQVPTNSDSFMGYGPVVPDGYGASYNPHADSIVFCLSAFHSCETTSTWKFAHSLEESLNSMKTLLTSQENTK